MADRYRVGAGGNWNDTNYWSATDGGSTGASVPTSSDNVFVNANASGTITVNVTANTLDLDFTGFAGSLNGTSSINVYGNLDLASGMTLNASSTWTMKATSGTKTIRCNDKTVTNFYMDGVGGTFQLLDKLSVFVEFRLSNGTFDPNSQTVEFVSTNTSKSIWGSPTFYNLTALGGTSKTHELVLDGNITVTNTLTITGNSSVNRLWVRSTTTGIARTITCNGTNAITNADFQDITGTGSASWDLSAITGGSGNCGGNSGITFSTPVTTTCSEGTTWSTATWSSRVPLPQDTANFSGSSRTITQDMPRIGSVDFTGSSGLTWTTSTTASVYGSINLTNLDTLTASTNTYTLRGRGSYTITSAGKAWDKSFVIDAPSGTYTLQDALIMSVSGSLRSLNLTKGTLDLNDQNLTCSSFASSQSNTRGLSLGSGTIELLDSGTVWNMATTTNLTFNGETATIKLTNNSTSSKTFSGGGKTYSTLWNATQGTGQLTIAGSNTFNDLKIDAGRTVNFTAGTTQTITDMSGDGTDGNLVTIQSTSAGSAFTLSKASGTLTVDYYSIKDSTATGGATFNATNSTNVSGNTGWNFVSPGTDVTITCDIGTATGEGVTCTVVITVPIETRPINTIRLGLRL